MTHCHRTLRLMSAAAARMLRFRGEPLMHLIPGRTFSELTGVPKSTDPLVRRDP